MILKQVREGRAEVENEYGRVATFKGNRKAMEITERVFEKCDAHWRGIGMILDSGMKTREKYERYDAVKRFSIILDHGERKSPCRCGDVLKGKITPTECPLFDSPCSPYNPVGPCMVSSEGTCAAYYKYGGTQ
jgi:hydrogenase expression/formation protein HypD